MTGQSGDAPRRLRRRPSGLKGRFAIAPRSLRDGLRPPLTPEPLRHLQARQGQASGPAPRGARRSLQITGSHQSKSPRFQGIPTTDLRHCRLAGPNVIVESVPVALD